MPNESMPWRSALYQAIGQAVQKKRNEKGITIREAAHKLGYSYQTVSRVESGEAAPTHYLAAFAQLAGCTMNDLVPVVPVTFQRMIDKSDDD